MEPAKPILANQEISEVIYIDQNSNRYPLHLNATGDIINFILEYNTNNYKVKDFNVKVIISEIIL